jgi:Zn-finger nucleic acid-binding protein
MYHVTAIANDPEDQMAEQEKRRKVNIPSFLEDYTRGASEEELKDKYCLSHSQLTRIIGILKQKGKIAEKEISERKKELIIRFGSPDGPPANAAVGKVSVELDSGVVLHCPSCGAAVKRGAENCGYCNAHLDFSLKGKTIDCPHCFVRTPADGRFCIRCAKPVANLVREGKTLDDRLCPRCEVPLTGKLIGVFSVLGCTKCTGLFVPHETFAMMQEQRDHVIFTVDPIPRGEIYEDTVRYVRCPICRNMMNRTNFARISGVIIDTCRGHGIWFDAGELEKLMDFIARGGLGKAKELELQRIKDEEKIMALRNAPSMQDRYDNSFGRLSGPGRAGLDILDAVGWIFSNWHK